MSHSLQIPGRLQWVLASQVCEISVEEYLVEEGKERRQSTGTAGSFNVKAVVVVGVPLTA
jgi:hypothetical protein